MTRSRTAAVLLAAASALAAGCKKSEPGAGGGPGAKAVVEAAPTPVLSGEPKLSAKAEAGATPFAALKRTHDIAVDDQGRVYATDYASNRLRVFDSAGASFGGWGAPGEGNYGLKDPAAVAVAGGDVYVCDTWNGRAQRFSLAGEWKGSFSGFYGPGGIAASGGRVAVTDTGHNQIVLLDADLKNPTRMGKLGKDRGEFSGPAGIAFGPSGSLLVADVGNRRIQVFAADRKFKTSWTVPGWQTWCVAHLEADSDETIYAADCSGDAVWAFAPSGKLVRTITVADDGAKFVGPSGLGLDRKNRILYVGHSGALPIVKVKLGQ